jgi:ClpP class serine protease
MDAIFGPSVTFLEELIYDADPGQDLHMILDSPGGDGEAALRMARSAQARCKRLTVIVPDQAKSAATILAMGAHSILMGPTSDLGPVDPQFQIGSGANARLVSAKDIIAAVQAAETAVATNPATYPLHASLLADVTALQVQQARSALLRTGDLVIEALKSNPDRTDADVTALQEKLKEPLIDRPKDHGAVFSATDAKDAGLPVVIADPQSEQWKIVWRLYTKYFVLGQRVYEGERASQILPFPGQG